MSAPSDDRNVASAVCRSTPNGLTNLATSINQCTSSVELNRNQNFATNNFSIQLDTALLAANVSESLNMGDALFGQAGFGDISKQVKERNTELKQKKETLMSHVDKNEAIIERSNRDFSDVKDTLPETQAKKILHFIEDYTLAILSISYLFMVCAAIYVFTILAENKLIAFGKSLISSVFLTCFMFMLLYFFS